MINNLTSISKRTLAFILSMLMLLSSGIVGTLAANVDLVSVGATVTYTADDVLFFNMKAVSWWTAGTNGNGNFAYFYNNSTNKNAWSAHAVQYSGDIYYVKIPAGTWEGVILTRNNTSTAPSWNNKWNQTGDIALSSSSNYISKFSENSASVTWSTQKPTSTASLSASSTSVNTNTNVTLTPSLTSNTTYNEINSTSYSISPSSGATISGNTFKATAAGTYTVTATITYNPRGYSNLTTAKTATTTITVTQPGFSFTTEANPKEGGSVTPASGTGTSVEITATPQPGYKFTGWEVTGNGSVADASSEKTTLTINANGVVAKATFVIEKYTITFVNGDGTTKTLNNIAYGSDVSSQAPEPAKVVGKSFSFWAPNVSGSTLTKITGATTFTATYTDNKYSVTVNSADGGYATAVPNADVTHGGEVTLTATVTDDAYGFNSWTIVGDYVLVSGYTLDTAVTKIKVNGPITVTPVFKAKDPHTLTINITGDTGKVKVDDKSYTGVINTCKGKVHSIDVDSNTNYYIKSLKVDGVDVPADKYSYVWHATFTVVITADTVIDVVYSYNPTVGAQLDVAGGKVTVETGKRDVTNSALPVTYKADVPYEITAPTGYYVNKVTIDGTVVFTAGANEYKLIHNDKIPSITTDKTIVVDFEKIPTLEIKVVADTANGSVTPAVGTYERQVNDVIKFTASPNSGYFVEWYVDGSKVGTGTTYNHTVTKNSTVEAKFLPEQWDCVLFVKADNGWANVNAYVWKTGTDSTLLGGWPGTAMELIDETNKIYAIYIDVPAEKIEDYSVIFNNGSAQTADLKFLKGANMYTLKSGEWSFSDLEYTPTKFIYGVNGSTITRVDRPTYSNQVYRGDVTFPAQSSLSNIDNSNVYYVKAQWDGTNSVDIYTTVIHSDFKVEGWVINATKFVKATKTQVENEYRGTIPAAYLDEISNDAVAVYSHSEAWFNAHPDVQTVRLFADISHVSDITAYNWGEYISAYTWNAKDTTEGDEAQDGGYEQFGEWEGQIMIPAGDDKPGLYYAIVEKKGNGNYANDVMGITFTNFGGHSPCNNSVGFLQTYDYYEFIKLQDKDNIMFVLQPTDLTSNQDTVSKNIANFTKTGSANDLDSFGTFADLKDYDGSIMDIYREPLTASEIEKNEVGLYVVRTGPYANNTTINSTTIDGQYYIDCFVYDSNKKFIGRCKSFELLDLESLAAKQPAFAVLTNEATKANFEGKIVKVAYEYPDLLANNNTRVDGEWYGTDATKMITLNARVARITENGYVVSQTNSEAYGTATIGGLAVWTGPMSDELVPGSITTSSDYKFVGWYHGTLDAQGNVVVDTSKGIISTFTDHKFTPYSNAYYVAVFEELAHGSFTVNNYSYEGNPDNPYAPPVFNKIGRDGSYRYVKIDKVNANGVVIEEGVKSDIYTDSPWASTISVQEGDILKITIYTTPKYATDRVYAWYMEAPEADGTMNYEEVGTEVISNFGAGEEATFSFTYVITENYQKNMIIYSDILTKTAEITLDYRYLNRYGNEKSYTKTYTLLGDELKNNRPSDDTIAAYAPFVNDLYKDVTWKIKNCVADSTGTRFVLEAVYDEEISVNISVNGESCATISGEFNESYSLYATDYDPNVTNKGFWYIELDEEGDGEYTDGVDAILSYGTYYGLVFTRDMDINYVEQDKLDFKVVLNSPVYGREQSVGGIDKVYTDFIINYLVPYFSGDVINGEEVFDLENRNAPIQLEVYAEAADVTIEYGMVHQMINTMSDDSALNEANKENYFNNAALSAEEIEALEEFLNSGKTKGMSSYGNGQLYNYKYTGNNEDLTNKNRALMTFYTNNTANNRNKYYSVVAYLAITDNTTNETVYYFSNVECFNINEFVNKDTNDLIDRN